jgi:hypothetical protein
MLCRLPLAAAVFAAVAYSVAVAAPVGPQDGSDTGTGLVTLAKSGKGGKSGSGSGSGSGGGKGGKGGKSHRHHRGGGTGIFIGVGYCAITAASCADRYGSGTRRYYWCLRDAGC